MFVYFYIRLLVIHAGFAEKSTVFTEKVHRIAYFG